MKTCHGVRLLVSTGAVRAVIVCILVLFVTGLETQGKEISSVSKQDHVIVSADFGKWVDYPLVKTKFGVYNSGYVPGYIEAYKRDIKLFDEVRPDSLRFDGGLGAPAHILFGRPPMISGTPPDLKFDFRQADELIDLLRAHNIQPYWCYSYVPECLVEQGQGFTHPPSNMDNWGKAIAEVAKHFRESGYFVGYHEIYNEPDNRDFFVGTMQDYLNMYETTVRAIRSVDPEAKVGGPSLAFSDSWIRPFLDHVLKNNLPLDFFSFHYYPGVPYQANNVKGVIDTIRNELSKHPELAMTEIHLNEYNSLPINYPENGPQQKYRLAAAMLSDYRYFTTEPSLTHVHWAQFMDTGGGNWSGMISIDGRRKAVFNAYKIYSMMPVDSRHICIEGPLGMGGMASSDDHRSALVIWNLTGAEQTVQLDAENIPFERGTLRVYRIDAEHASWGDNPANEQLVPVETRKNANMKDISWSGSIPDGGVVYLEADDESGKSELMPAKTAKVVRVFHYYPDRSKRSYADFDRNTWIARLGMAGETWADSEIGIDAEDLPEILNIMIQVDGELTKLDANSLLGVRLDYRVDGVYSNSVLFHGPYNNGTDLYSSKRWLSHPWGTRRKADEIVTVPNIAEFNIETSKYAPAGWKRRGIITFILQNAGPTVRAKITVR